MTRPSIFQVNLIFLMDARVIYAKTRFALLPAHDVFWFGAPEI